MEEAERVPLSGKVNCQLPKGLNMIMEYQEFKLPSKNAIPIVVW